MNSVTNSDIKDWVIYKITNPIGSVYVGKTMNFNGRICNYKNLNKSISRQRRIYNSLKEYGFDNHKVEIIDKFNSDESYANSKEIFWIRTNMSNFNKYPFANGLNLGDGGRSNHGVVHTEEMNLAKSISKKGRSVHTEESKRMLSESSKGNKNFYGKKHSEETKRKFSIDRKGKPSKLKGVKKDLEYSLIMSKAHKNRIDRKKPFFSEEMKKKILLARNTKPAPVDLFDSNWNYIQTFRSVTKTADFLGISKGITKRILNGLNENKFFNYYIKYSKC